MKMPFIKSLFLTITLFSLFAMDTNGQTPVKNYEQEWKKVEAAVNKGLPKSALEEVKKIFRCLPGFQFAARSYTPVP